MYAVVGSHHRMGGTFDPIRDRNAEGPVFTTTLPDAIGQLDWLRKQAAQQRLPHTYAVYGLTEMTDEHLWQWGVRTGETVLTYATELAAWRSATGAGAQVVRCRVGTDDWEAVPRK